MRYLIRAAGVYWRGISKIAGRAWLGAQHVSVGANPTLYGLPIIEVEPGAVVRIGERIVLRSKSEHTSLGVARPVIIRALAKDASIFIGDDVGMSGTTICAKQQVVIGNECLFGADVVVCDTDFHPLEAHHRRYSQEGVRSAPISIGDNVFIGARTIVLKGVSIGSNSVIGAGSVVASDVAANVIAAGNPCREIAPLKDSIN